VGKKYNVKIYLGPKAKILHLINEVSRNR